RRTRGRGGGPVPRCAGIILPRPPATHASYRLSFRKPRTLGLAAPSLFERGRLLRPSPGGRFSETVRSMVPTRRIRCRLFLAACALGPPRETAAVLPSARARRDRSVIVFLCIVGLPAKDAHP